MKHLNQLEFSPQRIPLTPPGIQKVKTIDRPQWSVMIPVYNCSQFLRTTLESVLLQDPGAEYMQIEVVDDCSTDTNVGDLVEVLGKGRVKYYRQLMNVGSLRNFETCLQRAEGYYIHLLHGDDFVKPGFYNEISSLFSSFPNAGAAFCNFSFADIQGTVLNIVNQPLINHAGIVPDFLNEIAEKQLIQPPSMVVKRSVYEELGGFYGVTFGEDWEMWARIASKYEIAFTPKLLAVYRIQNLQSISFNSYLTGQNIRDIRKVMKVIQTYLPEEKRKKIWLSSNLYYAFYIIKVANILLSFNRKAALTQVKGALQMSSHWRILLFAMRFYLMYIFRYKELESSYKKFKQKTRFARLPFIVKLD